MLPIEKNKNIDSLSQFTSIHTITFHLNEKNIKTLKKQKMITFPTH